MCEMCTEAYSANHLGSLNLHKITDEERRKLSELYIPVSTPPTLSPPLASTPEPNQIQNPNGHEDLDAHEKPRNEVNSERDQEMQSRGETYEKQQSPPIRGRKKRKLNMVKCQRCREDKKGCIWKSSEKCDRCIEKGHLCSGGTRAIRPRKLASKHLSPIHTNISHSVDSGVFEDRLKEWAFLKNYRKMMTMAVERLEKLEKDVMNHFGWNPAQYCRNIEGDFRTFVGFYLPIALQRSLDELLNTENGLEAFPARSLTAGQSLAWLIGSPDMMCLECCTESLEPMIVQAIESVDVCGAFLIQQHIFQEHVGPLKPDGENKIEELWSGRSGRYINFSVEIPRQAQTIFGSMGFYWHATYVSSLALYRLDIEQFDDIEWQPRDLDCLERTPLHRLLDHGYGQYPCSVEFMSNIYNTNIIDMGWWNTQDILGRTPLHILCQFQLVDEFPEELEKIIKLGVKPGLRTIYGSTPLHYAAAKGHLKICELLMEYKTELEIGAKDENSRTALDYAVFHEQQDVMELLIDHYEQDGLSEEIEEAFEIERKMRRREFFLN